jgi:hypothetical protein
VEADHRYCLDPGAHPRKLSDRISTGDFQGLIESGAVRRKPALIALTSVKCLLFELEQTVIPLKELDASVSIGSVDPSHTALGLLRLRKRRVT